MTYNIAFLMSNRSNHCISSIDDNVGPCHEARCIRSTKDVCLDDISRCFLLFVNNTAVVALTPFSSCVNPMRFAGVKSIHVFFMSAGIESSISVAMYPGLMQLTRQVPSHSIERLFARWTKAALDALY